MNKAKKKEEQALLSFSISSNPFTSPPPIEPTLAHSYNQMHNGNILLHFRGTGALGAPNRGRNVPPANQKNQPSLDDHKSELPASSASPPNNFKRF